MFQIDEKTQIVKKAVEPQELVEKARKLRNLIHQNEPKPIEYKPIF